MTDISKYKQIVKETNEQDMTSLFCTLEYCEDILASISQKLPK